MILEHFKKGLKDRTEEELKELMLTTRHSRRTSKRSQPDRKARTKREPKPDKKLTEMSTESAEALLAKLLKR